MRVLWITNILFPEADSLLSGSPIFRGSGGWMLASSRALVQKENILLAVATVSNKVQTITKLQGKDIQYYVLPFMKGNKTTNHGYEPFWKYVSADFRPDVVHIHGTEFSHGFAYVCACGPEHVVVSIQGLVSEIGKHYTDGLTKRDIYKNITFRDVLKGTCFREKREWINRGAYERELIKSVNNIIGRTSWDKSHVLMINPNAKYHHVDETLQDVFYHGNWTYETCNPHSIFISQAYYPIKGLHMALKAMPLILKKYPDAVLKVAGSDVTKYGFKHLTSYYKYLRSLISDLNLSKRIYFCGPLTSVEMKQEYLQCNVFLCPSSIENSSNALSEALLLGVPSVASCSGGLPSLMVGNEENIYRFDDISCLANIICRIFMEKSIKNKRLRVEALKRHNPQNNTNKLLEVYKNML